MSNKKSEKNEKKLLDVDEFTSLLKEKLCAPELSDIFVKGALQGLKRHTSGHVYFSLIGPTCRVDCALFKGQGAHVLSWPKDGDEIAVQGKVDIYGPRGSYQIIAARIWGLGLSAAAKEKELLKSKLTAEGLFDVRIKRPFPAFPQKIAVITSGSGAAFHDVSKVAKERYPGCALVWIKCQVQGAAAIDSIVAALRKASEIADLSGVMLVRGGGSRDDLNPFDDEAVVRAIRACAYPVASGVGHQTDSTLCDMASDIAAPTPSAAAEQVFPDRYDCLRTVSLYKIGMKNALNARLLRSHEKFKTSRVRLKKALNYIHIQKNNEKLNLLNIAIRSKMSAALSAFENRFGMATLSLERLSPLAVLNRGYAIASDDKGAILRSARSLRACAKINIRFKDGSVRATVD